MSTIASGRSRLGAGLGGRRWSPARIYLLVSGVYLAVLGGVGFLYNHSFPTGARAMHHASTAHIFGTFETNGWHNLAGLLFGVIALAFVTRPERARLGALAVGVPNAFVFITFAVADPKTFWIASNGADNVVHAVLGFGGILAALATRPPKEETVPHEL
jgi:hypothetical protein